jgi:hypothetical protein
LRTLRQPLPAQNVDGSENKGGLISHTTIQQLRIGKPLTQHDEQAEFYVTNIGNYDIILGTDWLCHCKREASCRHAVSSFGRVKFHEGWGKRVYIRGERVILLSEAGALALARSPSYSKSVRAYIHGLNMQYSSAMRARASADMGARKVAIWLLDMSNGRHMVV